MDKLLAYESKGWIGADVSIKDAERLFQTKYHEHENNKGEIRLGCDQYPEPAHLSENIDYITPGVKLSPPIKKSRTIKRSGQESGPPGWAGSGEGNRILRAAGLRTFHPGGHKDLSTTSRRQAREGFPQISMRALSISLLPATELCAFSRMRMRKVGMSPPSLRAFVRVAIFIHRLT